MKFSVITLFPDSIQTFLKMGVVGQAIAQDKIQLEVHTPRAWTKDIHKTVDDRPFGGGDGMVMMAEPLSHCIESVLAKISGASTTEIRDVDSAEPVKPSRPGVRRIYLSPQGRRLDHQLVMELAQEEHLLLLCGRYAGVDQRLLNHFEFEEVSIGDYVLSGGELGALVLIDSIGRQIEGVLGHESSSQQDSFAQEGLLEAPCFTRPRDWNGQPVPSFLLSGNHAQINEERWLLSVLVSYIKRPDLFDTYMGQQQIKKKVWQRAWLKLLSISNNELTSLGLTRKNLETFENQLKHLRIL